VKTRLEMARQALPADSRRRQTTAPGDRAKAWRDWTGARRNHSDARRPRSGGTVFAGLALGGVLLCLTHPVARAGDGPAALSLRQAVKTASEEATGVRLAALRVAEAEGRSSQTRSVFLPSLGGSAGFVRQTMNEESFGISLPSPPGVTPNPLIGPFNVWDARGEASQTLFSPAGWLRTRAAARGVSASRADLAAARQAAAAQAGAAYMAAAQARATLGARQQELALAQELQGVADQQLAAGVATRLDVVRAGTQVAAARSAIELAGYMVSQTQIDLSRALGLPPESRFALTDTLGETLGRSSAPETLAEAVALALEERPDLQAVRARVAAAGAAARAIAAERLGSLRLSGAYGYDGISPDDWIRTWLFAAQYSIPLFEGGRLEGRRHEQQAQVREASVQLQDLQQQVAAEVQGGLEALESGRARRAIAAEQLDLAQEEEREARQLFANGLAGNIEVINAQADLVRAHTAVIEAQAQVAQARVRLARAAGVTQTLE
jgi:outer membrane protein